MIAVGLDVSEKRMGWAAVAYDDQRPLALGVENLRRKDGGWPEDQVFGAMETVYAKLRLGRYDRHDVVVVGIEDAYLGPNKLASLRHASVVGMATMAARVVFGPTVTYWPIPAGTWRNAIGLKPASRKRADVKAATLVWATDRMDELGVLPDKQLLGEDEADALGIATACALLTVKNEAA